MKKSLIALAVVVILTMTVALVAPCFAENAEPIIFDLTVENTNLPGANGMLGMTWSGAKRGTSGYDAEEKAWKLESTKKIPGWNGGYEEFKFSEVVGELDFEEDYQYCVITYKTAGMHGLIEDEDGNSLGENKVGINGDGAATIFEEGLEPSDEYVNGIIPTEDFGTTHKVIIVANAWSGGDMDPGAKVFIKYIAFFATKAEAEAFDGTKDASKPETSEPETSEPEASEPEASEPEVSEPEASEPEASEPEESEVVSEASEVSEAASEASEVASEASEVASESSAPESSASEPTSGSSFPTWAYIVIAAVVVAIIVIIAVPKKKK